MPPVAIFLSTAKEIWKRTPPKTIGFWISLSSDCNCGAKRFRTESPALLSPLPLPRPAFERPQWAHSAHTYLAMSPVAHPVGAGVPDGPHRRTTGYRRTFVYPSVGVGFYPARRLYFAFAFMPPVAIFLSTAKEIWKRTPPKTIGFWISLSSNCNRGAKRFRTESPALLSPLPLLRPTRKLSSLAPYRGSALHPTYFYMLRPEGPHLSITARRKTPPVPASRV